MVKRNWQIDGNNKIDDDDRSQVKSLIVDVMLSSPESVQRQVSFVIPGFEYNFKFGCKLDVNFLMSFSWHTTSCRHLNWFLILRRSIF